MLQRELDPPSRNISEYLLAYYSEDDDLDSEIVEKYEDYIRAHPALLLASDPLENPVLATILPQIARILNSPLYDDIFVLLLSVILARLPLGHTFKFFPKDSVLDLLASGLPSVVFMIVNLVKTKFLDHDSDAQDFLAHSDFLKNALSLSLQKTATNTLAVASEVESLLELVPGELLKQTSGLLLLSHDELVPIDDATLTSRYIGAVSILLRKCPGLPGVAKLTSFPQLPSLLAEARRPNNDVDLLLLHVMIQFHQTVVDLEQNDLFNAVLPVVARCLENFASFAPTLWDSFIDSALLLLYHSVMHCNTPDAVQWSTEFLGRFANDLIDISSENGRNVFLATNLSRLSNKKAVYDDSFRSIPFLVSLPHPKFRCILHLFSDEELFLALVQDGKLSDRAVTQLPQNLVLELANVASRFNHSSQFLLNELPALVLAHLAVFDPHMVNTDLWKQKVATLENLLFKRDVELGVWKDGLLHTYREMVHGRDVTKVEPAVEVSDDFM